MIEFGLAWATPSQALQEAAAVKESVSMPNPQSSRLAPQPEKLETAGGPNFLQINRFQEKEEHLHASLFQTAMATGTGGSWLSNRATLES